MHQFASNVVSLDFNQVNVWVVWFWVYLNKVSGSDSSLSGQNLLSGMLCSVFFLLPPLLNKLKIFFWLWFYFCSVYNCNSLNFWLFRVWILLLSLVVPPPDFKKNWFLLFSATFCACYHYIVAPAYSCSVCSNLLTVIIPDTRIHLCRITLVLVSLVLVKLLTPPPVLLTLFL